MVVLWGRDSDLKHVRKTKCCLSFPGDKTIYCHVVLRESMMCSERSSLHDAADPLLHSGSKTHVLATRRADAMGFVGSALGLFKRLHVFGFNH